MAQHSTDSPREPTIEEKWRARYWLIYTLIGGLLPTWGGIIILIMIWKDFKFLQFFAHGEFALYAVSLAAPAVFSVFHGLAGPRAKRQAWIVLGLILVLVVSTLVFTTTFAAVQSTIFHVNEVAVSVISIIAYAVAVRLAYMVTLAEVVESGVLYDPAKVQQRQESALSAAVLKAVQAQDEDKP